MENTENREVLLKILIAEDDEISRKLLSMTVKSFAKEILIAKNGLEVVEICKENPDTDLILMDMNMPMLNGDEATIKIREFNNKVIILAQTAYTVEEEKLKIIAAGCNDCVLKPVNKTQLAQMIDIYFRD
ncbi:MAG: response regulator [Flavobacterium sp.]